MGIFFRINLLLSHPPFYPSPPPYTVKKVTDFPVPSRDVTNQTLPGWEYYSHPGRVWLVTSRLGTDISLNFFAVYARTTAPVSSNFLQPWSRNRPYGIWGEGG
jgi:hypothetical protein